MKVAATKTMCAAIAAAVKDRANSSIAHVQHVQLSPDLFAWLVDLNAWKHADDFSYSTGKYRVIRVSYAPECYAADTYVTSADLLRVFRSSGAKDLDTLLNAVLDDLEI